jgi:hypothetical protein
VRKRNKIGTKKLQFIIILKIIKKKMMNYKRVREGGEGRAKNKLLTHSLYYLYFIFIAKNKIRQREREREEK